MPLLNMEMEWLDRAFELCEVSEKQLTKYYTKLIKDAEECLQLADLLRLSAPNLLSRE